MAVVGAGITAATSGRTTAKISLLQGTRVSSIAGPPGATPWPTMSPPTGPG